jgi:polyisoprenoid-binding protein YceI
VKRALAAAGAALLLAAPLRAEPRHYVVDASRSEVRIAVGRAGLFKFAGHGHEVVARAFSGSVTADEDDLGASSVALDFEAPALEVSGKDEPPEDVPKVQEKMTGAEVLDAARFPAIRFVSQRVLGRREAPGRYRLDLAGELSLHGVTRALVFPVTVELDGELLTARASVELKQSDYGIKPVSVAGVVKVKNELVVTCTIVARAGPR